MSLAWTITPYDGMKNEHTVDELSPSIVRDNSKCINCRRCIAACNNMQKIGAIGATRRGFATSIGCVFGAFAGRFALYQLRSVHHRLSGRRTAREKQHQRHLERDQ